MNRDSFYPAIACFPLLLMPDAEPSIPLRRFGATHEIASLVAWLCSEGANYTTGQSLIVDGGFMLANPQFNPE